MNFPHSSSSLTAFALTVLMFAGISCSERALAEEATVDHLALAAVLIEGGDSARALRVLHEVDLQAEKERARESDDAEEAFDFARYYTLEGIAALATSDFVGAVRALKRARHLTEDKESQKKLSVSIAKAYAGQSLWTLCLDALDDAGVYGRKAPEHFLLRAKAHRALGNTGRAIRSYRVGSRRFPSDRRLVEGEIFLLVEHGLIREALDWSEQWREQASEDELLRLAAAVLRADDDKTATLLAEDVLLRFPASTKARVLLGHAAARKQKYTTVAHHFKFAADSSGDSSTVADAAEMYRRAGRTSAALRVGVQIPDAERKARQRFGILLEQERYAEASAMQPRLSRLRILEDDDVRIALAYCWLQQAAIADDRARILDRARSLLRDVKAANAFRQAVQMREAIESCEKDLSRCP